MLTTECRYLEGLEWLVGVALLKKVLLGVVFEVFKSPCQAQVHTRSCSLPAAQDLTLSYCSSAMHDTVLPPRMIMD